MRLLVTADIHSPKYLQFLRRVISSIHDKLDIDAVLIAGDLAERGSLSGYKMLLELLRSSLPDRMIIACQGNEDFDDMLKAARQYDYVTWLLDDYVTLEIDGLMICVYGSKGVLDRPTPWQRKHIKDVEKIYDNRLSNIVSFIKERRVEFDKVILLTHYSPTYETLVGERASIWPMLGTKRLESTLREHEVIAIHGHAHRSIRRLATLNRSVVLNASLPERWSVYTIELGRDFVRIFEHCVGETKCIYSSGALARSTA